MKTKNLGGRPRIEKHPQRRRNITLSDRLAKKAKDIGGTVSEGIRVAVEGHEMKKDVNADVFLSHVAEVINKNSQGG